MSVLKNRRERSQFQVFNTAYNLYVDIVRLLLRDFGTKAKTINLKFTKEYEKVEDQDKIILEGLLEKYKFTNTIFGEFPYWIIDRYRNDIINLLNELVLNIIAANTIFISSREEYQERRKYQNNAISNCNQLLNLFMLIEDILRIDLNSLEKYIDLLDQEIKLLKAWRRSDNSIYNRLVTENKLK